MKKAIDFLKRHKDVALATVGQNKRPKVRAFELMGIDENLNSVYCYTSDDKEVYTQIKSNPHVEFLAMEGDVSVRVAGTVHFDVPHSTAEAIYNGSTLMQSMYSDYKKAAYFRIIMDSIDYYDESTNPPTQENYQLV